jgi:hypothetical protein
MVSISVFLPLKPGAGILKPPSMKKLNTFVLFLLFAVASTNAMAQKLPVKLGLRVAPAIDWMNPGTKDYNYNGIKPGVTIGFVSDIYFADRYAFATGFDFMFLNGKVIYSDSVYMESDSKVHNGEVQRKYNIIYLQIPIMIKMKTKDFGRFSFYGQIGFGTAFRLKASATDEFKPDKGNATELDYSLDNGTTLIRESIIIGGGAEFHLDQSSRILVGLNYSNSLNNILTGYNYKTGEAIKSTLNFLELNIGFLF